MIWAKEGSKQAPDRGTTMSKTPERSERAWRGPRTAEFSVSVGLGVGGGEWLV